MSSPFGPFDGLSHEEAINRLRATADARVHPSKSKLVGIAVIAAVLEVLLVTPSAALLVLALNGMHSLSRCPWVVCFFAVVWLQFLTTARSGVEINWRKIRDMWR
jgi:hypothetical protein